MKISESDEQKLMESDLKTSDAIIDDKTAQNETKSEDLSQMNAKSVNGKSNKTRRSGKRRISSINCDEKNLSQESDSSDAKSRVTTNGCDQETKKTKRFVCNVKDCDQSYRTQFQLNRHKSVKHSEPFVKSDTSDFTKSLNSKTSLTAHRDKHLGQSLLSGDSLLSDHKPKSVANSSKKHPSLPFVCSRKKCRAEFANRDSLTIHLKKHSSNKPRNKVKDSREDSFDKSDPSYVPKRLPIKRKRFVCDDLKCGQRFKSEFLLNQHSKSSQHSELESVSTHKKIDPKRYSCNKRDCGYETDHAGHLARHMLTHNRQRCSSQDTRPAQDSKPATVKRRNRRSVSRRFSCQVNNCNMSFPNGAVLVKHLEVRHEVLGGGDNPYYCNRNGCDFTSSDIQQLSQHFRLHSSFTELKTSSKNTPKRTSLNLTF